MLMGFLTKNVSIVKLSSRNLNFPLLFAKSLQAISDEDLSVAGIFLVARKR